MAARRISKQDVRFLTNAEGISKAPFYFYVGPEASCDNINIDRFNLLSLPPELQVAVYQQCDPATLYALMRTCSVIRQEASKVFWARKEAWYHCTFSWLFLLGGMPGPVWYCPDFVRQVQQVEIETYPTIIGSNREIFHQIQTPLHAGVARNFLTAEFIHQQEQDPNAKRKRLPIHEQMQIFWTIFQRNFPAARKVVFSWRNEREQQQIDCFEPVIKARPAGLEVYIATNNTTLPNSVGRSLWCLSNSEDAKWKCLDMDWEGYTILIPPKQPIGLAGERQRHQHMTLAADLEMEIVRLLRLKAQVVYASEKKTTVLKCPHPRCRMPLANGWITHVLRSQHDLEQAGHFRKPYFFQTPEIPEVVEAAMQPLIDGTLELLQSLAREEADYIEKNFQGENYEKSCRAFVAQIENDPLFAHEGMAAFAELWQHFHVYLAHKQGRADD